MTLGVLLASQTLQEVVKILKMMASIGLIFGLLYIRL